jgi:quercetin dioxygenase-like cupin family protein
MKRKVGILVTLGLVGMVGIAFSQNPARMIEVTSLDEIVKGNPLAPGGPTVKVSGGTKTDTTELQVIEMSKIRLHHHELEDHIVYVARGQAKARLGDQEREVKAGDILTIPRRIPHGFTKIGDENLVLLVVATVDWKPLEDTKFYE